MGALILTKGTRKLMDWYNNHCFDKNSLPGTRSAIYGDGTLFSLFATPAGTTPVIQQITHNPTGGAIFLPPYDLHHAHLLTRWDYFLGSVLQPANHELLRNFLWNAINNGVNAWNDAYTAIVVDCVEDNKIQTVLQSDEYHLDGNGNFDHSTAYSHITLVTQTMSTQVPVPIDPQWAAARRAGRSVSRGGAKKAAKKAKKAKKAKAAKRSVSET